MNTHTLSPVDQSISLMVPNGNRLELPKERINNYPEVKRKLSKCLGVYKRNGFDFPCDAAAIKRAILSGEVTDFKKEFQFFPTVESVAEKMVNKIYGSPKRFLEPNGGQGHLIDAVLGLRPDAIIDTVELSKINYEIMCEKYKDNPNVNVFHGDFMDFKSEYKYDCIIANPPFTNNQDIDHIMRMYDHLIEGGKLISLSSPRWTMGSRKKESDFRSFIEDNEASVESIAAGEFKSSGTMIGTKLIEIYK